MSEPSPHQPPVASHAPQPIHLAGHQIVEVSGPDAVALLQGILTQDVEGQPVGTLRHGALLTPQGKYLVDALIARVSDETVWLDTGQAEAFARRLTLYRLRSKAQVQVRADVAVIALPPGAAWSGPAPLLAAPDPRLPELGRRLHVAAGALPAGLAPPAAWDRLRIALGVPELADDLLAEKDFALEGLMDELNGVDFHKGCYVGQEMTSRMKRRTTVRTKIVRVRYDGAAPASSTAIEADGWEVGQTRSADGQTGLALVRLDRALAAVAEGKALVAGGRTVTLDPPPWLALPETGPGG
jgi:tRNA-modifying protein YgfZ